uniref:non-specific serine/threonine protein kinase n=1 Tax=Spongospora subterranea TaxID=70186 RepID=A0A0H5QTJ3_9EUKA|eukprot:CRZ05297.1 hypothetical protein [Spongospora subterranea]
MENGAVGTEDPTMIFELLEMLGQGSYGAVYKARDKRDGKSVAVKLIPVENDLTDLMKEIRILEKCRSPNVVQYLGSYKRLNEIWVKQFLHVNTLTIPGSYNKGCFTSCICYM